MNHISHQSLIQLLIKNGGETGIRTPEPVAQLLPFQGSAIDHSAISPRYKNGHCSVLYFFDKPNVGKFVGKLI